MPYKGTTPAHLAGNKRYLQNKVDDIKIRVPKGEKEKIRQYAAARGKSLNAFIVGLIRSEMEKGGQ